MVAQDQLWWEEAAVEEIQAALVDSTFIQNRHEDELTKTIDKLFVFQEGVLHNIRTLTERVDKMEASTLTGFMDQGSSKLELMVEICLIWRRTVYHIGCALMGCIQGLMRGLVSLQLERLFSVHLKT